MSDYAEVLPVDFSELERFVEHDVELDKPTLIHRCAGRISYRLLTALKLLVFFRIGRDHEGHLYLI